MRARPRVRKMLLDLIRPTEEPAAERPAAGEEGPEAGAEAAAKEAGEGGGGGEEEVGIILDLARKVRARTCPRWLACQCARARTEVSERLIAYAQTPEEKDCRAQARVRSAARERA